MTTPVEVLREVFGYSEFRGAQHDIVDHICAGGDALVLMPTGGGKSLCYQLPAIVRQRQGKGVSVVVSPLIALMHDQVSALGELGIAAAFLKSTLDAALESMSDAVFIANREGSFIDFNEAFATFHRFPDKASCPLTLAEYPALLDVSLPSGESLPYENWPVPRALRGESAFNVEFTLRRRDTRESWIGSFNCAPIRGKGGSILGAVVTARDVTEVKQKGLALSQHQELN